MKNINYCIIEVCQGVTATSHEKLWLFYKCVEQHLLFCQINMNLRTHRTAKSVMLAVNHHQQADVAAVVIIYQHLTGQHSV